MSETESVSEDFLSVDSYLKKFEKLTCEHIPSLYRKKKGGRSRHEISYKNRVAAQLKALEMALLNPQDKDKSDQSRELAEKIRSLVHQHIRN